MPERETQQIAAELRDGLEMWRFRFGSDGIGRDSKNVVIANKISHALNRLKGMGVTLEELGFSAKEQEELEEADGFHCAL